MVKKPAIKSIKNKIFIIIGIILLGVSIIIYNSFIKVNKKQPQVKNGIIDLSNWDFEKDGVVNLDGEWEFYWNQLLTYEDLKNEKEIKPDGYFKVPNVWTTYNINDEKLNGEGYATYRLKIKADDVKSLKGLKILTASTSYKLMINDEVIAENGVVGTTRESSISKYRPQEVTFKNTDKDFYIIVQVSNFEYSRGGMWYSIYFGNYNDIKTLKEFNLSKTMLMLGAILIIMLYHVCLYYIQKRNKSALYFAIILLITAIRILVTGEYTISYFIPSVNISFTVPIEYMSMYWGVIMTILFIYELYPEEVSIKVVKVALYVGLVLSIFTIFTPISVFTKYLILYEMVIICMFIYMLLSMVKASIRKRDESLLLLAVIIIVFIGFVNDFLYQGNIISNKYGLSISSGVLLVIFIEAYILALRFSAAFEKAEKISKKLISLDKLKDEFITNTSHELRTPLNGITNITSSLLKGVSGELNFRQKENLEVIQAASRRLYNLVNDIIDISNLENNALKIYPKAQNISIIADLVIFVLEYLKNGKDIEFRNYIPKDFPTVFADEERLRQIFYNLLENALKFTEKGYIKISAEFSDSIVTIFIEDTGIGIKEADIDKLFNAYEIDNDISNKTRKESGIGLAITKSLVELQGGQITVKSEYGKGTCIFFTLPLAKENNKSKTEKIEVVSNLNKLEVVNDNIHKRNNCKYNILVVEYETVFLKLLVNNLNLSDYTVKNVETGYEALKLIDNGINFDVVILDVMLQDISGYEVLKKIREKYLGVELPVLLLTSKRYDYDISTSFRLGANDYLARPFEVEELNARVNSLINIKKAVNDLVASELAFLQAQIKPHFIYNALSVVSSLSLVEPSKAKELILDLSDYLRRSFDFESKDGLTTLKKELELVRAYLSIEQARFKERLNVEYDVDDINCTIPMLSLQPLVENAVRHGIMPLVSGGEILISAKEKDGYINIRVNDNGVGIDEEIIHNMLSGEGKKGSVGIKNINRRLIKLYGKGLKVSENKDGGTQVEFNIPYDN